MTRQQFKEFLKGLPELELLSQIAHHLKTELRLRGSLARNVVDVELLMSGGSAEVDARAVSLFDFVPAFSDIDLVVCSDLVAREAMALIRAHLPHSRFFHWDVRTPADLDRYRGLAYIALTGQPEIAFGKDAKAAAIKCIATDNAVPAFAFEVEVDQKLSETSRPTPAIRWNAARAGFSATADALIDLFYLARQYPDLLSTKEGRRLRSFARVEHILKDLAAGSPVYNRLVFGILKFLFSDRTERHARVWFRELCREAALRTGDNTLRTLLARSAEPDKHEPIVAIVRPENEAGRWIRRLHRLQGLDTHEEWTKESSVFADWIRGAEDPPVNPAAAPQPDPVAELNPDLQRMPLRLTPIAELTVEPPPDPFCCRYEDFARGTVELAWHDKQGPAWPVSSDLAILNLASDDNAYPATKPSKDDLALAHAYTVFGKIGAMRTDYNFLSILAGRRRPVKLVGAGKGG
jgi:hypothetical protein